MTTDDWYENYKKSVAESAKKIKVPKEITQDTLWQKAYITKAIEDANPEEGIYTFSADGKFGFSERYVNYIIQISYELGRENSFADAKVIRQNMKDEILAFIQDEL